MVYQRLAHQVKLLRTALDWCIVKARDRWFRKVFWRIVTIIALSFVLFFLEEVKFIESYRLMALDWWTSLRSGTGTDKVLIVSIDEVDYQTLFGGKSPLATAKLEELVVAIERGGAKTIGVDIDTDLASFHKHPNGVWVRCHETDDDDRFVRFRPKRQLSDSAPNEGHCYFPVDEDGCVRSFQQVVANSGDEKVLAMSSLLVKNLQLDKTSSPTHPDEERQYLRFLKNPNGIPKVSARYLLMMAANKDWPTHGIVKDKIVILGGQWKDCRDKYHTPLGSQYGVDLVAEAVATELTGFVRHEFTWWQVLFLDMLVGLFFAWSMDQTKRLYMKTVIAILLKIAIAISFTIGMFYLSFVLFDFSGIFFNWIGFGIGFGFHLAWEHYDELRRENILLHQQLSACREMQTVTVPTVDVQGPNAL